MLARLGVVEVPPFQEQPQLAVGERRRRQVGVDHLIAVGRQLELGHAILLAHVTQLQLAGPPVAVEHRPAGHRPRRDAGRRAEVGVAVDIVGRALQREAARAVLPQPVRGLGLGAVKGRVGLQVVEDRKAALRVDLAVRTQVDEAVVLHGEGVQVDLPGALAIVDRGVERVGDLRIQVGIADLEAAGRRMGAVGEQLRLGRRPRRA